MSCCKQKRDAALKKPVGTGLRRFVFLGPTGVPQPLMTAAIIAVPDWCPPNEWKLPTQNPSFRLLNHENVNRCR